MGHFTVLQSSTAPTVPVTMAESGPPYERSIGNMQQTRNDKEYDSDNESQTTNNVCWRNKSNKRAIKHRTGYRLAHLYPTTHEKK